MHLNLAELQKVRCRYGCSDPIGIYHMPDVVTRWPEPVQALCEKHLEMIQVNYKVTVLIDLRMRNKQRAR